MNIGQHGVEHELNRPQVADGKKKIYNDNGLRGPRSDAFLCAGAVFALILGLVYKHHLIRFDG